jgi:hypothetical protein
LEIFCKASGVRVRRKFFTKVGVCDLSTTDGGDDGDFKPLDELKEIETANSNVLPDLHYVLRRLSVAPPISLIATTWIRAFPAEAAVAAAQTRSEDWEMTPVLYCHAFTGKCIDGV